MMAFVRHSTLGRFIVAPALGAMAALLIAGLYLFLR